MRWLAVVLLVPSLAVAEEPSSIVVSLAPVGRYPLKRNDWSLSYEGLAVGMGIDFAVPHRSEEARAMRAKLQARKLRKSLLEKGTTQDLEPESERYLFYHFSADAFCMRGKTNTEMWFPFCGYRIAPLGLGYWVAPAKPGVFEQWGIVTTGPQVEYVAGRVGLEFPTQSKTMLGIGAQVYGGWFFGPDDRLEFGVAVGVDTRFITIQSAGVASGFGADLIVRPMLGVQGW